MKILHRTGPYAAAHLAGAAIMAAAMAAAPMSALAAPSISGTPQSVVINAQNSSVEEILAGLSHEFKLQYRSSADLGNKVTGSYAGSLRQVLGRILKGYNFILATSAKGIEVTVLGTQGGSAPHTATVPAKPAANPAARPTAAASSQNAHAGGPPAPAPRKPAGPVPVPETKLAEGGPPMPKPAAPGTSYPVPTANTKDLKAPPMPVASAASAPMPMPVASAGGGPMPQFQPSSVSPPMPTPAAGPANGAPAQQLPTAKGPVPN